MATVIKLIPRSREGAAAMLSAQQVLGRPEVQHDGVQPPRKSVACISRSTVHKKTSPLSPEEG